MDDTTDVETGDGAAETKAAPPPAWEAHELENGDFAPADSSREGLDTLKLEVTVLSIAAVDTVASEIARKIEPIVTERKLKGVVIADPDSIGMLRSHIALMGELASLEAQIAAIKPADDSEGGLEAGFVDPGTVYTAARGARAIANNVGKVLGMLDPRSSYQGAEVQVAPSVVHAALAKHIAGRGIETQVPRYSVARKTGSEFIDRLIELQRRCQSLNEGGAEASGLGVISDRINALVQGVFGTTAGGDSMQGGSSSTMLQRLAEAEMYAAAIDRGFGLLTIELTASGGSYRIRKWILNGLLGRDSLTYSGGAAVTYFLLAGGSMASLASDTVYFASGHGSFGNKYQRFSPTNIPGLSRY